MKGGDNTRLPVLPADKTVTVGLFSLKPRTHRFSHPTSLYLDLSTCFAITPAAWKRRVGGHGDKYVRAALECLLAVHSGTRA